MDLSVTVIYKNFITVSNSFFYEKNENIVKRNLDNNNENQFNINTDIKSIDIAASIDETYEEYFDVSFPKWISILILAVGILGNLLCLLVFFQKTMRKNSTFIYLAFLSIVDIFVLVLGLGDIVLISYTKIVLRNQSAWTCRSHVFLTYLFTHLSSFILASVSIDRAIATNFINFAKVYCKPKMAYKVMLLASLLSVIINFHTLFFMGYQVVDSEQTQNNGALLNHENYLSANYTNIINSSDVNGENYFKYQNKKTKFVCATENDTLYEKFIDPYFEWIDLIFYAILPFLTMAICTFLIIRVLFRSNKRLKSMENQKSLIKDGKSIKQKKNTNKKTNKARHLTYTLITLNALFFFMVSPLVIFNIIMRGKQTETSKIFVNIIYLLAYSNHSFNFLLYTISSPPYRETLIRMFDIKNFQNKQRTPV